MFVLMSKKAAAKLPPSTASAAHTRTQNACDACRIRKAKCDGQTPCSRCRGRRLVCTSSRKHTRVSGPITEEHIATLQEQQRRLTRAVSRMAEVIKQAESRGFTEDEGSATNVELSSLEMAELLERFAPEEPAAEPSNPSRSKPILPAKKRKLHPNTDINQEVDVTNDDSIPGTSSEGSYRPFERFFATVQQHNNNTHGLLGDTALQAPTNFMPQPIMPMNEPQYMSFEGPGGDSTFDFHPQLTPFVDMVDWDASLEHFLNHQYNQENTIWDLGGGEFGVSEGMQ